MFESDVADFGITLNILSDNKAIPECQSAGFGAANDQATIERGRHEPN